MWKYEKKLEYPVNIRKKDIKMAKNLLSQYGGPNSEMSACLMYMNQRYSMPDDRGYALLTDIATEELAHKEIIATIKEKGLQQVVKDTFGKNFTNCTTSDLESVLKKEEEIVSPEDQDNNYTENKEEYGLCKAFEYLVKELFYENIISEKTFDNVCNLLHHTDVKITKKPSLESKYSDDDIEEMFAGMIQ